MRTFQAALLIWLLAQATVALAENQSNPLSAHNRMVTYMRMKDVVPPASKADFMKQAR
jgi:hypothetical protein